MIARKVIAIIEFTAKTFIIAGLSLRAIKGAPDEEGVILMMAMALIASITMKMTKEIMG